MFWEGAYVVLGHKVCFRVQLNDGSPLRRFWRRHGVNAGNGTQSWVEPRGFSILDKIEGRCGSLERDRSREENTDMHGEALFEEEREAAWVTIDKDSDEAIS